MTQVRIFDTTLRDGEQSPGATLTRPEKVEIARHLAADRHVRRPGAEAIGQLEQGDAPLGDDTAFVPGHGPMSTFGQERRTNPFVADRVLARA